jgi:hypothetical protein
LTPEPPVHDHVLFQAIVVPLMLVIWAQSLPDAPEMPHWSRLSTYGDAETESHCPQCDDVSTAVARSTSAAGAPSAVAARAARTANLVGNMLGAQKRGDLGWKRGSIYTCENISKVSKNVRAARYQSREPSEVTSCMEQVAKHRIEEARRCFRRRGMCVMRRCLSAQLPLRGRLSAATTPDWLASGRNTSAKIC